MNMKNTKLNINHKKMGEAYIEMGAINLRISQEDFHLEEEGAKYYEMDSKKAEGEAN